MVFMSRLRMLPSVVHTVRVDDDQFRVFRQFVKLHFRQIAHFTERLIVFLFADPVMDIVAVSGDDNQQVWELRELPFDLPKAKPLDLSKTHLKFS